MPGGNGGCVLGEAQQRGVPNGGVFAALEPQRRLGLAWVFRCGGQHAGRRVFAVVGPVADQREVITVGGDGNPAFGEQLIQVGNDSTIMFKVFWGLTV
ncbi:hypothetical protein D3C86_2007340 [compost metagenome]